MLPESLFFKIDDSLHGARYTPESPAFQEL